MKRSTKDILSEIRTAEKCLTPEMAADELLTLSGLVGVHGERPGFTRRANAIRKKIERWDRAAMWRVNFKDVTPSVFDTSKGILEFFRPSGYHFNNGKAKRIRIGRFNSIDAIFFKSDEIPGDYAFQHFDILTPEQGGRSDLEHVIQYNKRLGGYLYGWVRFR